MRYAFIAITALLALVSCSTQPMNSTPIACTLSRDELSQKREELLPGLLKRAEKVSNLSNGLRLHFTATPGLLADLTRVIEQERTCCKFLRFRIAVEPSDGPITFDVTGPPGTRDMLRSL
jgi:hypothetical protein